MIIKQSMTRAVAALTLVLAFGTSGYMLIEGWTPLEAVWMVVITLTTIGFGEVHHLTDAGRVFTIVLIMGGVSVGAFAVSQITRAVLEGELTEAWRRRRRNRQMLELNDHFIVVGYGRLGRAVVQELRDAGVSFCVIERDPSRLRECEELGICPVVLGDGADDAVLREAGLERAKGLAVAVEQGAEAIFVTLSARELNPSLNIVTRVEGGGDSLKARRAGASKVVSPQGIGGWRMAHSLIRPNATHFLDLATLAAHDSIMLDELLVRPNSSLVGQSIKRMGARELHGVNIVALHRRDGTLIPTPRATDIIEADDVIIVIGEPKGVRALAKLARAAEH